MGRSVGILQDVIIFAALAAAFIIYIALMGELSAYLGLFVPPKAAPQPAAVPGTSPAPAPTAAPSPLNPSGQIMQNAPPGTSGSGTQQNPFTYNAGGGFTISSWIPFIGGTTVPGLIIRGWNPVGPTIQGSTPTGLGD